MTDFQPEPFGKYYLIDKIATGGMAEIFKAKTYSHGGFENLMVIKRILSHLGENEEFVEMFIDEAKVSVALQHANIIRIYDFGKMLDNYYIAMECVDGKDVRGILRKLSRRRQYLPIEFAAYIGHQVCRGLAYAHEKNNAQGESLAIVHRDISPSNILVSYEGDVKIADFGIAKAELNQGTTDVGILKGKFEYMSPEQATGKRLDGRSDLFSLGIILHEILTGRRLFKSANDAATLERIKSEDIPSPSSINNRVPQALEKIIMKALARDRDKRYRSAKEMQADLEAYLYPTTPDLSHQSFARFMHSIFSEEIAQEATRLEEGSKVAETLRKRNPAPDWEEQHLTTHSTGNKRKTWIPVLVLSLLVIFFSVTASVGVVMYLGSIWATTEVVEVPVDVIATTGILDITVLPAAELTVNGKAHGLHQSLTLPDLEPGTYQVTATAKGYTPYEEELNVEAGKTAKFLHYFTTKVSSKTSNNGPTDKSESQRSASVDFQSSPASVQVVIDGKVSGTTPFLWTGGKEGTSYSVEYRKEGFSTVSGQLSGLSSDDTTSFSRTLEPSAPVVAEPGKLSIGIIGGGWGTVYIDGKKLSRTAPMAGHTLPAGKHTVRVVNQEIGLDYTQTITVKSGQVMRVNARP